MADWYPYREVDDKRDADTNAASWTDFKANPLKWWKNATPPIWHPTPGWHPYFIEAQFTSTPSNPATTYPKGPILSFKFHKLVVGAPSEFPGEVHTLDLTKDEDKFVPWLGTPSILGNLSSRAPYALIFLTKFLAHSYWPRHELYVDGHQEGIDERGKILSGGTGGNTKWPIGAGSLFSYSRLLGSLEHGLEQQQKLLDLLVGRAQ